VKRAWCYALLALSLAVNAGVVAAMVRERVRIERIDRKLAAQLKDNSRRGVKQFFKFWDDWDQVRKPMVAAIDSAYRDLGRLGLQPDADSAAVEQVLGRLRVQLRQKRLVEMRLGREYWAMYRPEVARELQARSREIARGQNAGDSGRDAECGEPRDAGRGR
jgi:hypothetical protein